MPNRITSYNVCYTKLLRGNHVLVNGRKTPRMLARSGAPQRWHIINAAKSRYYKLDLGEDFSFTRIGSDGGLLDEPVLVAELVITSYSIHYTKLYETSAATPARSTSPAAWNRAAETASTEAPGGSCWPALR